jgi:hypothetical protein
MILNDLIIATRDQLPEASLDDFVSTTNREVSSLMRNRSWRYGLKESRIEFAAPITDGTVTVTNGSTTVTLAGDTWTFTVPHMRFYLSLSDGDYRVVSLDSPTQITLDRAYEQDTEAGVTYTLDSVWVPLPSDFSQMRVIAADNLKGKLFRYLPPGNNGRVPGLDSTTYNNPGDYYMDAPLSDGTQMLRFKNPAADSGFMSMYYWRKPTPVTTPGDSVDIPDDLNQLLEELILNAYLRRLPAANSQVKLGISSARLKGLRRDANNHDDRTAQEEMHNVSGGLI